MGTKLQYNYNIAIGQYKAKFEKIFSQNGLTLPIAEKFFRLILLPPKEIHFLFCLVKEIPDGGTYLEIGSWFGGSLVCVHEAAKFMKKTINLIAIEPSVKQQLLTSTKSISNFRLIRKTSDCAFVQIDDNSVDFLFLDGDHGYKQVGRDILNYWPKIKMDGVLLGHDYAPGDPRFGVQLAADEIFSKKRIVSKFRMFRVKKDKEAAQIVDSIQSFPYDED